MKNTFVILSFLTLYSASPAWTQNNWTVDKAHSRIGFSVSHLVIAEVDGIFKDYSGMMIASTADFTDAKIDFSVKVASIFTDNEMRDNHLKSDDFFNVEKFPVITFKSTSFKKTGDKKYLLEGDLTIRDVTKRVRFDVVYGGTVKDPYGNTKTGFKANTTINRFDYNLKWNTLTEAGGAVAGRDVQIVIKLEFQQEK